MLGRRPTLDGLSARTWDLVVIGGGITGAGVLLEAARRGRRALLVERNDFASGASSRSSKMVHGGLRYLAQGRFGLTRDALVERERLVRELPDLVIRQPYLYVVRRGEFPGRWPMELVLGLYDAMAGIRDHRWLDATAVRSRVPGLAPKDLAGAMAYTDALTDDARLVLRILHEAAAEGGQAVNHAAVETVAHAGDGFVVAIRDAIDGSTAEIRAAAVIHAAGAWTEELAGKDKKIRPLRGSHLFFTRERLPVDDCIAAPHPDDRRPVYAFPWVGMTCVGTTDLDHVASLGREPSCSRGEMDYLFAFLAAQFPDLALGPGDVVATMAGLRPVVPSGKGLDPSQESRDHVVWRHDGMVSVAGGKLTTFRLIALDALAAAGLIDRHERRRARRSREPLFRRTVAFPPGLGHPTAPLPEGEMLTAALDWSLACEMVGRLDDLLLRRVRVGLARADHGRGLLPLLEPLCAARLGWDAARFAAEAARYAAVVETAYAVPSEAAA